MSLKQIRQYLDEERIVVRTFDQVCAEVKKEHGQEFVDRIRKFDNTYAFRKEIAKFYQLMSTLVSGMPIYDHMIGRYRAIKELALNQITKNPGLPKKGRIIDVCSGTGLDSCLLAELAGKDSEVVGVDFCAGMVRRATERAKRRNLTNAYFIQGDRDDLPVQSGTFDLLLCSHSLEEGNQYGGCHSQEVVRGWSMIDKFKNFRRVLKPTGKACLVIPVDCNEETGGYRLKYAIDENNRYLVSAGFRKAKSKVLTSKGADGETANDLILVAQRAN